MKKLKVDLGQFVTPEQVKAMDVNELIERLETKLGRKLDGGTQAWLAIAKGAGSVHTIDLGRGQSREESVNWDKLAEILNGPDGTPMPPYLGPSVDIENCEHFVEVFLFALKHSTPIYEEEESTRKLIRKKAPVDSLLENLLALHQIAQNYTRNGWHFKVFPDMAKHSFGFVCHDAEGRAVYNGGLILHKPWNGKENRYEENERMHWSLHT